MMTFPIPDKFQRRIELIENSVKSISRTVDRSSLRDIIRDYREESSSMKLQVNSNVIVIEAALRELKDLLEDDTQKVNKTGKSD